MGIHAEGNCPSQVLVLSNTYPGKATATMTHFVPNLEMPGYLILLQLSMPCLSLREAKEYGEPCPLQQAQKDA